MAESICSEIISFLLGKQKKIIKYTVRTSLRFVLKVRISEMHFLEESVKMLLSFDMSSVDQRSAVKYGIKQNGLGLEEKIHQTGW